MAKIKLDFKLDLSTPESEFKKEMHEYFYKRERTVEEILLWCTIWDCSDLYIKVFERPHISRYGKIYELPTSPIKKATWEDFYEANILNELNARYVRNKSLDTSLEVRIPAESEHYGRYEDLNFRYRLNLGYSNAVNIMTARMIRPEAPSFSNINYPKESAEILREALKSQVGMIFICGATGSGKSTTFAASINDFSKPNEVLDNKVITTLEDPIEYQYKSRESFKITQKELGKDFKNFSDGLRSALREHPNIILVGESRDKETITTAIEAARTGHLISSTLHSSDVAGSISRLMFYLNNDEDLAYDLVMNLNLIICQRLIPSGEKFKVDVQYMLIDDEIREKLMEINSEGKNISVEVNKLMNNKHLLEKGLVKNWENV